MENRQIIIRLDAGHKKGMGHLFRMIRLAKMFAEKGYKPIFLIRTNVISASILENNNFSCIQFSKEADELTIITIALDKYKTISLWIFDLLGTKNKWYSEIKKENIPVVTFDDLDSGFEVADLVINAIRGCRKNYPCIYKKKHLSGPKYIILPQQILSLRNEVINNNRYQLGISMGGSDTYDVTGKIVDYLTSNDLLKNKELHVFLGPHYQSVEKVSKILFNATFSYKIHSNVPDLLIEINKMDAVICGGGQSLFEFAALGKLIMACANETHEEDTIGYFERKNACINIGSVHNKIYYDKLKMVLESQDFSISFTENAMTLVDGMGLLRCFQKCLSLAISGRLLNDK